MTWTDLNKVVRRRHSQHGLGDTVAAGLVLHELNKAFPNLCRPISLKNGVLSVVVEPVQILAFKLQEGDILRHLQAHSQARNLPPVTSIKIRPHGEAVGA